jgi:hypothetical protein
MAWILSGSILSGCGETSGAPEREMRSVKKSEDVSRRDVEGDDGDDSDRELGDDAMDHSGEDEEDQESSDNDEDDIEIEDDEKKSDDDTSTKKSTDKTKSKVVEGDGSEDRHSADVKTVKQEDKGLTLYIKAGKNDFQSMTWPEEDATTEISNICLKGEVTTIEIEINDPDRGRFKAGSAELGLRKSAPDFVEIGYESKGGCTGKGCQDDNILTISCKGGIKIKGLE